MFTQTLAQTNIISNPFAHLRSSKSMLANKPARNTSEDEMLSIRCDQLPRISLGSAESKNEFETVYHWMQYCSRREPTLSITLLAGTLPNYIR
jgi:hypothetical protein